MKVPDVDYGQEADFGQASLVDGQADGGTPTPVVRLDSLGLPRLDFLKLDIEGMEIDALRGARRLIETHLPWCWIEYWKVGEAPIIATFAGLDYTFYRIDGLNMLCVPNPRWDRQKLIISGEPLAVTSKAEHDTALPAATAAAADAEAPETNWNLALDHESRGEWGHAIDRWHRARGRASTTMRSRCSSRRATASPARPKPAAALERFGDPAALPDATRGRIELARSALLLRAGRRDEAALATIASENVLTAAQFGLATERLYQGQPLQGKRLLVLSYGGVGDQLQYARYLPALGALGCTSVTVVVPDALTGLLRHTFPHIEFIGTQGAWVDTSPLAHDYWCSCLMLAAQFGYAPAPAGSAAAYLSCPPERAAAWRERVSRDGHPAGTRRIGAQLARARRKRRALPSRGQPARLRAADANARPRRVLHQPRPVRAVRAIGPAGDVPASRDRRLQRPGGADAGAGCRGDHLHRAHPRRRRARRAGRAAAQPESRRALGNRLAHRALSGHPDRARARVGQWDDAIDRAMAFVLGGFGKD